jgi:hypothetical protein
LSATSGLTRLSRRDIDNFRKMHVMAVAVRDCVLKIGMKGKLFAGRIALNSIVRAPPPFWHRGKWCIEQLVTAKARARILEVERRLLPLFVGSVGCDSGDQIEIAIQVPASVHLAMTTSMK